MDRFIQALDRRAQQGVDIKLIFDAFGSLKLNNTDRQTLQQAGIELFFYNPVRLTRFKHNLHRTHRKIIVIDNHIAFTGGAGISDHFEGEKPWRETMLKIRGEVVTDWQQLFLINFQQLSKIPPPTASFSNQSPPGVPRPSHTARARVVYSNGGRKVSLKRSLLKRIYHSRHTIWLTTAYFIPTRKLRRALQRAAYRGKDVRLLLPGEITDHPAVVSASRRYYSRLLRHGVRIYEYQGRFMHAKVTLVDDWSSIGSSNMDRWNLKWNLEANQEVIDPRFATAVQHMLASDFEHSKEIHYKVWRQRSRWQRFKEWLWGNVDLWLTRWQERL